jgi:hypothetical protein
MCHQLTNQPPAVVALRFIFIKQRVLKKEKRHRHASSFEAGKPFSHKKPPLLLLSWQWRPESKRIRLHANLAFLEKSLLPFRFCPCHRQGADGRSDYWSRTSRWLSLSWFVGRRKRALWRLGV